MFSMRVGALAAIAAAGLASSAFGSFQDDVTIFGEVYFPEFVESFELSGQSAYVQQRTNGGTTGGQLDGIASGGFGIGYAEVFPEANLTDYLQFGYFGVVHSYAIPIARNDGVIVDTSFVLAMQPGVGEGLRIDEIGSLGLTEAQLVDALTGGFDTPEFFAFLGQYGNEGSLMGTIGLPQESIVGDTLDLIAFIGGEDGDRGVKIGELNTSIVRVPSPGALSLFGMSGVVAARRRR